MDSSRDRRVDKSARVSGELLVMGAPCVVAATLAAQTIGQGDNEGSERALVLALLAQWAASEALQRRRQ
jgi:hypothetical protein